MAVGIWGFLESCGVVDLGVPWGEYNPPMPYPETFIAPMRAELTRIGVRELRTPEDVDTAVSAARTIMIVVNSMCGCAAGKARPGIALALGHSRTPDEAATVFAGADIEATSRVREYLAPYPPSSPSVALFRDGQVVFMLERKDIENRDAAAIAQRLTDAFDQYCGEAQPASTNP